MGREEKSKMVWHVDIPPWDITERQFEEIHILLAAGSKLNKVALKR